MAEHVITLTTDELTDLIGVVGFASDEYMRQATDSLEIPKSMRKAEWGSELFCRAEKIKTKLEACMNGEEMSYLESTEYRKTFVHTQALKIFHEAKNNAEKLEALKILERENYY